MLKYYDNLFPYVYIIKWVSYFYGMHNEETVACKKKNFLSCYHMMKVSIFIFIESCS